MSVLDNTLQKLKNIQTRATNLSKSILYIFSIANRKNTLDFLRPMETRRDTIYQLFRNSNPLYSFTEIISRNVLEKNFAPKSNGSFLKLKMQKNKISNAHRHNTSIRKKTSIKLKKRLLENFKTKNFSFFSPKQRQTI